MDNSVSGPVAGSVVQAGGVRDVHIHHVAPEPVVVPRQLPPQQPRFANRQRELSRLDRALDGARPVVVLSGFSGAGKTALALRWLHGVADRFPDGQLYADLGLSTDATTQDVLGQFLRSLGIAPARVPAGVAECAALYRSVTAGKRLIVLLDNVSAAAQARVLLPASSMSLVVVTSRWPLPGLVAEGAEGVEVGPLDAEGALQVLAAYVGWQRVNAERGAAEELGRLCGHLSLALVIAGVRAVSRPRRRLDSLVVELADERHRLDGLSVDAELSVRANLEQTYAELSGAAQQVYRLLGLHPPGVVTAEMVTGLLGVDLKAAGRGVEGLLDAGLLEDLGDRFYRLHDAVRAHAVETAMRRMPENERSAAYRRMWEWYLHAAQRAGQVVLPDRRVLPYTFDQSAVAPPAGIEDRAVALDWLERARPALVAALDSAGTFGWAELAYHLADALVPLYIVHKHDREHDRVCELGLDAARAGGNPRAADSMRKRLIRSYIHRGQLDLAEEQARDMLRDARERGDARGQASALKSLGMTHAARTQHSPQGGQAENDFHERAAAAFRRTVDILRQLRCRRSEGLALIHLGQVLTRLDQTRRAIEHLSRAHELLSTVHPPATYNVARATRAWGEAHLQAGDLEIAGTLLHEALEVFTELGSDAEAALTHRSLARYAATTGNTAGADEHDAHATRLQPFGVNTR